MKDPFKPIEWIQIGVMIGFGFGLSLILFGACAL